jgi:hypothetical protein
VANRKTIIAAAARSPTSGGAASTSGSLRAKTSSAAHAPGPHSACAVVVGGDKGNNFVGVDAGVEDRNRNAASGRALNNAHQRIGVDGGEHDAVGIACDQVFDDGNLAAAVDLELRSIPGDIEIVFLAGGQRSRLHRKPENMICTLGDYAHEFFRAAAVAGRSREAARSEKTQKISAIQHLPRCSTIG